MTTNHATSSQTILPLVYLFLLSCFFSCSYECEVKKVKDGGTENSITGIFVFGSSLVDNGNNNFLVNSKAKADYLPYGIDFPLGPSGRFTNGKNVVDLLGDFLKVPSLIPAFSDPSTKGNRIVHGVNYASGASGILDDTGSPAGNVISLSQQIRNFEEVTLPDLKQELGYCRNKASSLLENYLFVVGTGGNDYSFNYFLFGSKTNLSLQSFTANLTSSLSHKLKKLYSLGGRKFLLISVNPLGCSPTARANKRTSNQKCMQEMNEAAHLFNNNLKSLVDLIKPEMPGSTLVYLSSYKIIRDIIRNPASEGFKDAVNPCCEVPSLEEGGNGILCKRGGKTCENRSSHVFFDGLHPTEAVNVHIARKAFASRRITEVYPINIQQLAKI